ncbi:MAG TPA: Hsp20/alpha crystallin family protein [Candidatus Desulfovibrio intestinipullorum]|uniref:Hsp20/alpha crystallin family protein n=1 Tax=Candidatus Desulfovibrio intestinipullorum TaxID=2838536 RepID=A0A9D1PZQ8_9BACT|nr:Hsp20/alpha crystallin family protein [Candidatus Desulfovibrio intestinipullorum]
MSTFFEKTNFPTPARLRGVSQLHDDIDRLFGGFLDRDFWPSFAREDKGLLPQVDLKSDDKQYILSVELPGVAPEEVKIEVTGRELTISGEKKEDVMNEAKTHVKERRYGSFSRSMTLPEDADADSIRAVARNGVLTLEIARKVAEADKPRSIEVQKG